MNALSKIMWLESLLLVALLGLFFAGALDGKTYAYLTIGVLVIFAIPSTWLIAAHRAKGEKSNG